MAISTKILLVK